MHHRLEEILAEKQNEVDRLKRFMPFNGERQRQSLRDFKAAISKPRKINLIAEIKFASPSAGLIRKKSDPVTIARIYEDAGAAAISLLTDQRFFQGDLKHLPHLKKAIDLPILRKDFIIDEVQIREAFIYGADAILLIARILSQQQLTEFIAMCRELGVSPLTEVHSMDDLEKTLISDADIIGINNRDLDSFRIDINTTRNLAPLVPDNRILVSESGINNKGDVQFLKHTGVRAMLVGSALMRSDHLAEKTAEFVNAGMD